LQIPASITWYKVGAPMKHLHIKVICAMFTPRSYVLEEEPSFYSPLVHRKRRIVP
jgi:hypothetical protein